jgi:signal transduction histidine kinase/ActR/RegA family two-component response regulator
MRLPQAASAMPVTIRSRLLTLVLSVLLPGLLGVAWLVGRAFEAERFANERALRETARALATVAEGEFSERATIARTLAASHWLNSAPALTTEQIEGFQSVARQSMAGLGGWVELRAQGRALLDTRAGHTPTDATRSSLVGGDDLVEAPQVRPLQQAGDAEVAHAAIVQPVRRNGRTVLNIIVALRPRELQRIFDAQRLPTAWIGAVIDRHGIVMARHPGGDAYIGRPISADLRTQVERASEGQISSSSIDGSPMIGYYSTSAQGWTYLTAMPREQFAGNIPQTVVQIFIGALAMLALAIGGALWVSRGIVGSVQMLKEFASRMQAGKPLTRHSTGIVELDAVAAALTEAATSLQNHRQELERRVDEAVERTRQAAQRTSQSQRIEALGRLTGGVAHDFNNLLGIINNSAHLIQRHANTPEVEVPVAATMRAVEVGSRLTQHLLRFAGRRPLRPQWLQLGSFLPELVELLRSVLGRRIEISVTVEPDTLPVRVDSSELELALINLSLNARDAMPAGGELALRARNAGIEEAEDLPFATRRRYVLITVTDTGQGLAADVAERAFEPFFTTKAVGQGTGLGLSQVHGFCTQAGGTVRIASKPGSGTTVSLLLPAAEGAGSTRKEARPVPSAEFDLSGRRILVVDDNTDLSRTTLELLRSHGAEVERAIDADEALQLLQIRPDFDVVLTDVVMPGEMDGIALARRLRVERPTLPVVLTSGFNADATGVEFTMLRKPTSPTDLLRAMQEAKAPPQSPGQPPVGAPSP